MPTLLTFDDYAAYVETQRMTVARRGIGPYFSDVEIRRCAEWLGVQLPNEPRSAICHGARNGLEVDEFKKHFPSLDAFGTDLFPFSGKSIEHRGKSDVVEHDFCTEKQEWLGRFDFVYSNSFDHAIDPVQTLSVWLDQVKDYGRVLISWCESNLKTNKGDCFGASLWEWVQLGNMVGAVIDLLYCHAAYEKGNPLRYRAMETVVLGIRHKREGYDCVDDLIKVAGECCGLAAEEMKRR